MKPENILIFNDKGTFSIKMADFGISKALNPNTTLTTIGVMVPGTPAWIAPEVVKEHVRMIFKSHSITPINVLILDKVV